MKKSLIAAGVIAAFAGAAHAQSSVTISGTFDAYVGSMKIAGDKDGALKLGSGGMTTSWFGFRGAEDLGKGLKAEFAISAFFQGDTGTAGRGPWDPNLFSRDANVALSGDFGKVMLGRSIAPNFLPTILFNPFGDSFTFSPLVLHKNVPVSGAFPANGKFKTVGADTGWSNQVTYTTPRFGGLSANLHYQFGEQAGENCMCNSGVNLLYFGGPLALTAYYENTKIANPGTNSPKTAMSDWMFGGSYDLKVVKLFGTYGQAKPNGGEAIKTYSLGASAPVGPGVARAGYANTRIGGASSDKRDTFTLGYGYDLSKRTDLYGNVMYDKQESTTSGTSIAAGVRHRF